MPEREASVAKQIPPQQAREAMKQLTQFNQAMERQAYGQAWVPQTSTVSGTAETYNAANLANLLGR